MQFTYSLTMATLVQPSVGDVSAGGHSTGLKSWHVLIPSSCINQLRCHQIMNRGSFRKIPKGGQKHVGRCFGGRAYCEQYSILKG